LQNINRLKRFVASLYGIDPNAIQTEDINLPDVFHDIPTDSDLYRRLLYEFTHQKNG
jgi:hypothetical protein